MSTRIFTNTLLLIQPYYLFHWEGEKDDDDSLLKFIESLKVLIKIKQVNKFREVATALKIARKTYEVIIPEVRAWHFINGSVR